MASRRKLPCLWILALTACPATVAWGDYTVQDNVAFNAKKINPYTGGPAFHFEDTIELFDERLAPGGPVTIGPLEADPLGATVEALFGVDLPHVVKLKTGASLSGHALANFGYYVTAGRLDISYPASASLNFETAPGTTNVVQASRPYAVDGGFLPGLSQRFVPSQFLTTAGGAGYATAPLRSQTSYEQPWFETQAPWASAWVEASADIQGSLFTKVSALGGLKEWRKDIQVGGKVGGRLVEIDPTGLYVAGEEVFGYDLTQPIGPIPIGAGAADLTIRVPDIAVSSVANGNVNGAVISAYKEQPLVTLTGNLERLIPFVGTILQNNIGPLGYDLLNLAGGPQLSLYQEMTFTPDPKVRLTFSEPVLVGASNVPTNQAEFDLDEAIVWRPMFSNSSTIKVRPTYLLDNTFRNETGLNVDLVVDVETLSLTGDFPPFNGTLGPVYENQLTIPIFGGGELFAPQFKVPLGSVAAGSLPGLGPITTGEITFQKLNLDIQTGLGDMQLLTSTFVSTDPNNGEIQTYDLQFTRTVQGGSPRMYSKRVTGLHGFVDPEGANVGEYLVSDQDVIVTDDVTGQNYNLGKSFTLFGNDLSALLPTPSPAYVDPNPSLGKLYVSTQPDDLSVVPNVDLNVTGHPILDQYNAGGDFRQDSTVEQPTEFVDRALYPNATILVRHGEVIPEGIGRFSSFGFGASGINEAGGVGHYFNLTAVPPGSSTTGFYYSDEVGKNKLFRFGELVPGSSQTFVSAFGSSSELNESGQVAMVGRMSGSFSNSVVLRGGLDGLKTIARNGQIAPDGSGTFLDFFGPSLNDAGQVAFLSRVTYPGVGRKEVMYVSNGTVLTEIVRQGDAAPGLPGEMSSFGHFSFNNSGQVSFDVFTTENVQGLYIRGDGGLQLIASDRGAVPQGGEFAGINDQDLNNAGQIAFAAGVREFPGGPLMFGLFRGGAGSLVQIAREGQSAPDGDGTLKSNLTSFRMNDAGQVVFRGQVDAATDYEAILLGSGGSLTQIARKGTTAPNGAGFFDEFDASPQINNLGHVAFGAAISSDDEKQSLFVHDGVNIVQVVRIGQPLAGSTVTGTTLVGINDRMQVAYQASLANATTVLARFEPSLYWSKNLSGNWDATGNWSLGVVPRNPYDVHIVAENALTVAGPSSNRTVKALSLGATDSAAVTLHLASGVTLTVTEGATIRPNGVLTGHGALAGTVTNEGTISPGASPGALTINGDFIQTSSGKLVMEIASATNYDQLLVSGNAALGGTLQLSLLNGFTPAVGQTFEFFNSAGLTGAFSSIQFPAMPGLSWDASQLASGLLTVVLAGDFNRNGVVDGADLAVWKTSFGAVAGASVSQGDANGDGAVNGADFLIWQRQLGATAANPSSGIVPEPRALVLIALGLLAPALRASRPRPAGHTMSPA